MKRKTSSFSEEPDERQDVPRTQPAARSDGPVGPPKNSVTMIADMVTVFMNSARKNRAKRIDEYSVWKPPTSSCSASTRSNGGRFSSAVPAMRNTTNGTRQRDPHVPVPARLARPTMALVERLPALSSTASERQAERRLVGDHLGGGPHRRRAAGTSSPTTSRRASRRRRRSSSWRARTGCRSCGSATCRKRLRAPAIVTAPSLAVREVAADRDDREHEERGDQRAGTGASRKTNGSARSGMRSSLKKNLMPSARVWRMPERTGQVRADAVRACRRGSCARTRSSP